MDFHGLTEKKAWGKLQQLARAPFDLTGKDGLNAKRISEHVIQMKGFKLLYGTQRVDPQILQTFQELADECGVVDQFINMKEGAAINRIEGHDSENRMVLHTAVRDIFAEKPCHPDATAAARVELAKLQEFLKALDSGEIVNSKGEYFSDFVLVGIGGSDLGPRALYLALEAFRQPGRRVHFISNVDPDDAARTLKGLDLSKTLVNVVSKSGTTLETLTNEELVRNAYIRQGLDPAKHFIAVTGKGSPMDDPARYLQSFYMFDYIGGRYSVTSMVGAVMLGFALGYEAVFEILRGANEVDVAAEQPDIFKNIPLMLALLGIWNHNFLGCETVAILPYSQALVRFTAHLQQCDMESNGKSIDQKGSPLSEKSGPIVWGEPGTNGQHAFYQLIHQGTTIVPVEFIGFVENQYCQDIIIQETSSQEKLIANLLAQSIALATGRDHENPNRRFAGNRPSSILCADRLTPCQMGALLAIYEAKITMQGFIWGINSFDQEGVQLGKMLATQLLEHIKNKRKNSGYEGEDDQIGWAMLKEFGSVDVKKE